jgi:hypothetical protein
MSFEDVAYPLPDEDLSEIALCAIKFPNSMKLLLDPNVWIADTGATVHATPNSSAMVKKSERNGNDSVTMVNGKSEATEWYGDLHVTLCDMEGNTKGDSKMTHVAYVPTSKFNLFTLTRMMINNWILGGDENSIWLEKGRKNHFLHKDNDLNWCYLLCVYETQVRTHQSEYRWNSKRSNVYCIAGARKIRALERRRHKSNIRYSWNEVAKRGYGNLPGMHYWKSKTEKCEEEK